jgi:hypothetical protein
VLVLDIVNMCFSRRWNPFSVIVALTPNAVLLWSAGFNIASEGVQAALVANEVNKASKMKKLRDEQKAKEAAGGAGACTAACINVSSHSHRFSGCEPGICDACGVVCIVKLTSSVTLPVFFFSAGSSPTKEKAAPAAGATPAAAAPAAGAEAEIPAMTPEEEAAMKEKIERLSGHMFAVM